MRFRLIHMEKRDKSLSLSFISLNPNSLSMNLRSDEANLGVLNGILRFLLDENG